MTASILPSHTSQSQVKVNVRLCGSIPRLALSMQDESLNVPLSLRSLPLFPSSTSNQASSSLFRIDDTKKVNEAANKLCSDLWNMQQLQQQESSQPNKSTQPQHNFYPGTVSSSRQRSPTTYEAPSWAVPASGEARLEVSMEVCTRYIRNYIWTNLSLTLISITSLIILSCYSLYATRLIVKDR